jgi:hypothetical protein
MDLRLKRRRPLFSAAPPIRAGASAYMYLAPALCSRRLAWRCTRGAWRGGVLPAPMALKGGAADSSALATALCNLHTCSHHIKFVSRSTHFSRRRAMPHSCALSVPPDARSAQRTPTTPPRQRRRLPTVQRDCARTPVVAGHKVQRSRRRRRNHKVRSMSGNYVTCGSSPRRWLRSVCRPLRASSA